jgi:amidase
VVLDTIAGPDAVTARGWRLALPRARRRRIDEYRVAVVYDDPEAEVDEAVGERLRAVAGFLAGAGATVLEDARPGFDSRTAHENYLTLLRAATSRRLDDATFADNLAALRALDPADETYRARAIRAQALHHRDWLAANELRHRLRLVWEDFFAEVDLLLCPTATTDAFPLNEEGERWERMVSVNGREQPSTTQMFWAGYSCNFYLPATVAPAGLGANGRPVGVQIVGPQYRDHECIRLARLLEREFQGFVPPPGYLE